LKVQKISYLKVFLILLILFIGTHSGKVGARFRLDEATEVHLAGLLKDLARWRIPFTAH